MKVQQPKATGAMAVAQRRITEWGYGVVGVAIESHLRPAHNKREYEAQESCSAFNAIKQEIDNKPMVSLNKIDSQSYHS
jgi:2-methylisocitrate lyase-like PEP mutase family enzyme